MRFFTLILTAFMWLLLIYYITWVIHNFVPIFGKWVSPEKAIIPFYGWIKMFKGPKFFIIGLLALSLSSCGCSPNYANIDLEKTARLHFVGTNCNANFSRLVYTFEWDGHKWYRCENSDNFLHHPDCPCLKSKNNSEFSIFN